MPGRGLRHSWVGVGDLLGVFMATRAVASAYSI